mmetsp:Transcript_58889/g.151425  ORF Transcript_58889/g.151425 Transcript_58889/m.151425 type:complete len:244 (-) Transcript_58889:471-1202(-)
MTSWPVPVEVGIHFGWSWPWSRTTGAPGTSDSTSSSRFSPPQTLLKVSDGPSSSGQAKCRAQRAVPAFTQRKRIRCEPVRVPLWGKASWDRSKLARTTPEFAQVNRVADGGPNSGLVLRQKTCAALLWPPMLGRCPATTPALRRSAAGQRPPAPRERGRVETSKNVGVRTLHCLTNAMTVGRYGWYAGIGWISTSTRAAPRQRHSSCNFIWRGAAASCRSTAASGATCARATSRAGASLSDAS